MVRLEDYNNLHRKEKELLNKGFNYDSPFTSSFSFIGNEACIKVKASELYPLATFKSLCKLLVCKASGWQTFIFKHTKYAVEYKRRPDGKVYYSVDYPQEYLNYARLILQMTNYYKPSMEVIRTHPNAIISLKLDTMFNVRTRASIGKPELGAGFKCKFNIDKLRFSKYELASWWFKKHRQMVVKQIYTGKSPNMIFDEVLFSYYEKLDAQTYLAASASLNLDSKDSLIEFGVRHQLDDVKLFKAKVNSNYQISLTHSLILIPFEDLDIRFLLSSSAQVDLLKMSSHNIDNCKLGFRLDLKISDY